MGFWPTFIPMGIITVAVAGMGALQYGVHLAFNDGVVRAAR
jgi:hypothetical protein